MILTWVGQLYSNTDERLCICRFVKRYEANAKLAGCFSKPISSNYYSEIFKSTKYLGSRVTKANEKSSIQVKMDHSFDLDNTKIGETSDQN